MRQVMMTLLAAVVAAGITAASPADAGLFGRRGAKACDGCEPGCQKSCDPCDYRCKRSDKLEPVEKSCATIEVEAKCIPPITTSPFDCFRGGSKCGGCGRRGCGNRGRLSGCDAGTCSAACDTATCDAGNACSACDGSVCGGHGCSQGGGLFSCFRKNSCGKIRCVKKLGSESYKCGEKCVTKWEAVSVDCCGHEIAGAVEDDLPEDLEDADAKSDADDIMPPAPDDATGNEATEPSDGETADNEEADEDLEDVPAPPEEDLDETQESPNTDDAPKLPDVNDAKKPDLTARYYGARKRS